MMVAAFVPWLRGLRDETRGRCFYPLPTWWGGGRGRGVSAQGIPLASAG